MTTGTDIDLNTGTAENDMPLGENLAGLVDAIATEIKKSNNNISTLSGNVSTLTSDVSTLTSDVDELKAGWLADPDPDLYFKNKLSSYNGTVLN